MDPQQALPLQCLLFQGIHKGSTGAVLGMQHPPVAVGRLESGAESAVVVIKIHPQLQQPLHAGGSLLHEQFHGRRIAQPTACPDRVVAMAFEAVVRPSDCSDAALGPAAGGAGCVVFAEQQHPQLRRELEGRHQPGGSAAHHDDIPIGGQLNHGALGLKATKKAAGRARRLIPVKEFNSRRSRPAQALGLQRYWPSLIRSKPSLRAIEGGVTVKLSLYFSTSSFWRSVRSRLNRSSTLL